MSMRDILGKLTRIDESMTTAAKKPTGPKFVGKWKGTDPASAAKDKLVGASESILKDLERALVESPKRDIAEEYKRYAASWCQVCGQSPCNCTTLNESEDADGFYVIVASEDTGVFIGALIKDGGRWRETTVEGNPPYNWGGNFMSYLSPQDIMQHIRNDYRRGFEVAGPFTDDQAAMQYAQNHFDFGSDEDYDDVMEVTEERDAIVKQCAKLAAFYMQSENLRSIFTVDEYIYKKMGIQQNVTEAVQFNSKQEVINHFISNGKSAAAGAAAWERGWRGTAPKAKPASMNNFKFKQPPTKSWQELDEYGGVGGYGAASQAPAGATAQTPDPAATQAKADAQQIQKNTNQIAGQLNQQGAAQSLNKVKFSDTMTKLDSQPNAELNAQELKQMEPLAVATSKALQNPQTAGQMKQLIGKADTLNKQKDLKVQQAQQQVGTNAPAGAQPTQSTNAPQPSAGQTK
jgi:hypothetical protein